MLSYKRAERVGALIQQEISRILQELKVPGMGFVTVTGVKLTDDLQSARVFYSVIGNDEEVSRTGNILKDSIPDIRHQLALRLNLRRTPTLHFEFDETPTRAARVFELLDKIKTEDQGAVPAPEQPKPPVKRRKKKE